MKMVPFLFFGILAVIISTGVECDTTSPKEDALMNPKNQCSVSSDCANNLTCVNQHCIDPCHGLCAAQALCNVINHFPICTCPFGYTGDAFTNCYPAPKNDMAQDTLIKPECTLNIDCPRDEVCLRSKCVNPPNAQCSVINHIPVCSCPSGTEGNAFFQCEPIGQPTRARGQISPCRPTPCGYNSQCREMNGHAVCACLPGFVGRPPTCRPECTVNTDCASDQACVNQKCINLCESGICGENAECSIEKSHIPYCRCIEGYNGNPFNRCFKGGSVIDNGSRLACYQKCGRNEECLENENGIPSCGCKPGYRGTISFGCVVCETKFNCASNQTCNNELECVDPCPGTCGSDEDCYVFNHKASCRPKGSHPECSSDTDCPTNKACDGYKCIDPCLDLCRNDSADCRVIDHEPICNCKEGFYGSPYRFCFRNGSVE